LPAVIARAVHARATESHLTHAVVATHGSAGCERAQWLGAPLATPPGVTAAHGRVAEGAPPSTGTEVGTVLGSSDR